MDWKKQRLIFPKVEQETNYSDYFSNLWDMPVAAKKYFNQLFNRSDELSLAMDPVNDMTVEIIEDLIYAVENESNQIIQINAEPNEGKSLLAQAIGLIWLKLQKDFNDLDIKIWFSVDYADTIKKIALMKDGDLLIQDEVTTLAGTDSIQVLRDLNNILKTMRQSQRSVIFCTPKRVQFSVTNLILEPIGKSTKYDRKLKNYGDMKTRALVSYPRNGKDNPIGHIILTTGWAIGHPALSGYLDRKVENIHKMIDNLGRTRVDVDTERRDKQVQELYDLAIKGGWDGKKINLLEYYDNSGAIANNEGKKIIMSMCVKLFKRGQNPTDIFQKIKDDGFIELCINQGLTQLIEIENNILKMYPDEPFTTKTLDILKRDVQKKVEKSIKNKKAENLTFNEEIDNEIYEYADFVTKQGSKLNYSNNQKIMLTAFAQGKSIQKIVGLKLPAPTIKSPDHTLSYKPIQDFRVSVENTDLALWAEQYVAVMLDHDISDIAGPGSHAPDLIHDGHAWSIKTTWVQQATHKYEVEKKCKPEFDFREENNQKYLIVCLINTAWPGGARLAMIKRSEPYALLSRKSVTIQDYIKKGIEVFN
jgi:hypothetical protein